MADNPAQAQAQGQGQDQGGAEEGRVRSLDARFGAIEAKQREQDGVLGKILDAVGGGAAPSPAPGSAAGGTGQGQQAAPNIAEQVRREIAEADRRRQAEESEKTWRAGVDEAVEKLKAEGQPREPEKGVRGRLQRILIGKEPS